MPIFRLKYNYSKDVKFVGVYLPSRTSLYLTLYGMANELTKTSICEKAVDEWFKQTSLKQTQDELIKIIGEYCVQRWKEIKQERKYMTPLKYSDEVLKELKDKGIPHNLIKAILKIVEYGTNEESRAFKCSNEKQSK